MQTTNDTWTEKLGSVATRTFDIDTMIVATECENERGNVYEGCPSKLFRAQLCEMGGGGGGGKVVGVNGRRDCGRRWG